MTVEIPQIRVNDLDVPHALDAFEEASLDLLDARVLLRRVDRKYILPKRDLDSLLTRLGAEYRVVRSAGRLAASYQTCYFDTPDRQMFEDHRRGRRPRYKVRVRHHVDRTLSFLEIKRRDRDRGTTKTRMSRPFGDAGLDTEALTFIDQHCPVGAAVLAPRLWIDFRRITLVGHHVDERLTIDWAFELRDDRRGERLPGLVIAEVKQGRYANNTPAVQAFRSLHVRERTISKYCLATARLAAVRTNSLKPALRAVERLSA